MSGHDITSFYLTNLIHKIILWLQENPCHYRINNFYMMLKSGGKSPVPEEELL